MFVLGRWLGWVSLLVVLHLVLINGIEIPKWLFGSNQKFMKVIAFLQLPVCNFIFCVYLT